MNTLRQCSDKQEWDDYVLDNGGHPLQLWGWGEIKKSRIWRADRLFLTDENAKIIGAAQMLIRRLPWPIRSLSYVPRGPIVGDDNRSEMLDLLADYAKNNYHSVVLKVEPDSLEFPVPNGWIDTNNYILPSRTISLNLKKPEEELLSDMDNQTRRYIRKSNIESIKVKLVKSREDLDKCLAIYHATARRAKFNLHSDQYYYDVFDKLGDNSPVFAAYVDDQPVAFLWLAISSTVAFEFYAGMNEDGRHLNANHALKWYAIRKCKEWGLARYDFGGLIAGGVETFKMGWAKQETKLAGTFDRPLSVFYGFWNIGLPLAKTIVRRIKAII